MSDAKSSIVVLCKFVNLVCKYKIQPIHFKLAKHNKVDDDVVCKFWNLLNTFTDAQISVNVVENVKIYFAGLNYKSLEFYSLPDNMSFGSRELVLAFSWLIGKHNILQRLIKDAITKSIISQEFILNSSGSYQQQPQKNNYEFFSIQDYQNNILRLAGNINTNLKMISEYNDKILKLMEKVHKQTTIANSLHLSVAETHYLKTSQNFHSYLNEIKHISDMLDVNLKWKSKENIYWDWMITVINLKTEEKHEYINKEVIGSLLKVLRAHAKPLLATNPLPNVKFEILNENLFSRCLKTSPKHNQMMLLKNEKFLREIDIQEKNNVQKIINFLCIMIKEST